MNIKELLFGEITHLSNVNRYSGMRLNQNESVAEHSYYVALFSYAISEHLESKFPELTIELSKLLTRCLLHDISEAISGDIIRPFKHSDTNLNNLINEKSSLIVKQFEKKLKLNLLDHHDNAKDESLEGFILKIADLMSVLSFSVRELFSGNKYTLPVICNAHNCFVSLRKELMTADINIDLKYQKEFIHMIDEILSYSEIDIHNPDKQFGIYPISFNDEVLWFVPEEENE